MHWKTLLLIEIAAQRDHNLKLLIEIPLLRFTKGQDVSVSTACCQSNRKTYFYLLNLA